MKTCFETAQSRQNDGVALGGVRLSEVVKVLVRFERVAFVIEFRMRNEAGGLVLVDGFFHAIDAKKPPFIDGHFVDKVAFREIARTEVVARSFDKGRKPWDPLGSDREDTQVDVEGHRWRGGRVCCVFPGHV